MYVIILTRLQSPEIIGSHRHLRRSFLIVKMKALPVKAKLSFRRPEDMDHARSYRQDDGKKFMNRARVYPELVLSAHLAGYFRHGIGYNGSWTSKRSNRQNHAAINGRRELLDNI